MFCSRYTSLRPESYAVSARLAVKLAVKKQPAPIRELSLKYQEKWVQLRLTEFCTLPPGLSILGFIINFWERPLPVRPTVEFVRW